jgi:hypothetical protein
LPFPEKPCSYAAKSRPTEAGVAFDVSSPDFSVDVEAAIQRGDQVKTRFLNLRMRQTMN